MPSKSSLYSGGYSSATAERLDNVPLPDKIKCVQCQRHFMHSKFSQNQLSDYQQRLLFNGHNPKLPKCRQCVGGPATELTCNRCELTKDLNAFTKVQRRKPDTAHCKDCQQEVDDVEPNIEDALQEQEILETQTSIGSYSLYNYDSLRGSQPALISRTGGSDSRPMVAPTAVTSEDLLHFDKSTVIGASGDGVWTRQNLGGQKQAGSAQSSTSGMSGKQSGNWARPAGTKPDRGALREAEKQREAQRKVQEQERARFEEEGSSGSDWEL